LKKSQVDGIASLVASSIEGLESKDVVVLDTNGNILGDMAKDAETMGSVGNQWELQNSIETEMQTKVQEIVEGVVGLNNSVVKVTVDMNFDQIERTTEEIDPENVVVVSENTMTESSFNVDDSSNFKSESTTSNYELSKKMERYVSSTGTIERLTVAVLLNGKYQVSEDQEGNKTTAYIPRDNNELDRISALVKSAVGFSEERGDIVEVQNLQFDNSTNLADKEYFQELVEKEMWEKYITYGLLALAIILGFVLVRMLFKSSINNLLAPALARIPALGSGADLVAGNLPEASKSKTTALPEPEEEISEDLFIKKLSPEARAKLKAKDKMTAEVIEFTKQSPEDASKLIRSWLAQDKRIKI
jgi:flagellar M-ring protein FliF